jgi:hypothetical protein
MIVSLTLRLACDKCGRKGKVHTREGDLSILPECWIVDDEGLTCCFRCNTTVSNFAPTKHIPKPTEKDLARFMSKLDRSGGPESCWIFGKGKSYGTFVVQNDRYVASRVSYSWLKGEEIPDEMFVCHTCDVRGCCNPRHLFLGTNEENILDRVSKNRSYIPSPGWGGLNHQSTISKGEIAEVFRLNKEGYSHAGIAKQLGFKYNNYVSKVLTGKIRPEDKPEGYDFVRARPYNKAKARTKYTKEQESLILERLASGWAKTRISKEIGCEIWFVYDVIKRAQECSGE